MATNAARRLASLSKRLGEFDQIVVTTAGKVVYDAIIAQLERDTGGDRALSGIAGGRYKLDVDITPLSNPAGVRLRPKDRQTGMWSILSKGTSPHELRANPRRKQVRKIVRTASRARAMNVGGSWRAGPWKVGGTRGKNTWQRGVAAGLDKAVEAVRDELHKAVSGG